MVSPLTEGPRPLEGVSCENFKGLGSFSVSFASRLSVLIGANGVGKSSVLQAIELLGGSTWGGVNAPSSDFRNAWSSPGLCGSLANSMLVKLSGPDRRRLQLQVDHYTVQYVPQSLSLLATQFDAEWRFDYRTSQDEVFFSTAAATWFRSRVLRLELDGLQSASPAPTATPSLERNGHGLPSVLGWLAATDRRRLELLEASARAIVPGFDRVSVAPVRLSATKFGVLESGQPGQALSVVFRRGESETVVPAQQVSEGTLLVLGILAAAYSPGRPRLLLLEDIDRGLHPSAQRAFIGALRGILAAEPDLQIIATTHSPYLLDNFEECEVIVMRKNVNGHVRAKRFSEHPKWEKAAGVMSVGEFWTSVGEDWIFGDGE